MDGLHVTFDGNFHFNLKWKKTDANDVPLTKGAGFFVHTDDIGKYLKKVGKGSKQKEARRSPFGRMFSIHKSV